MLACVFSKIIPIMSKNLSAIHSNYIQYIFTSSVPRIPKPIQIMRIRGMATKESQRSSFRAIVPNYRIRQEKQGGPKDVLSSHTDLSYLDRLDLICRCK